MGEVIYIQDTSEWYKTNLAKRNLAWHRSKQNDPMRSPQFDFSDAIEIEETYLRSFFKSLKDRAA